MVLIFLLLPYMGVIAENHLDETATQTQNQDIQQVEFEQAQHVLSEALTAKAESLVGTHQGQCVVAVRNFLGVGRDQVAGLAKNTKVNSQLPEVGAIIILRMSWAGHVGVVLFTTADRVYYYDSNGDWREKANIHWINTNDNRIKGYRIPE